MTNPTVLPAVNQARVLVVDDEASVCSALARSLTLLGYNADAATSGHQALGLLEWTPYDAMVLDIRMPDMDGVKVMQRVSRAYPDLSVIFLTGHASLESAISAVRFRAADYLLKPASVYDIAAAIERTLQRRIQEDLTQTPSTERFLRVGPVILDRERNMVSVARTGDADSYKVQLTVTESALLVRLMLCPDTALSCRELARVALNYDLSKLEAQAIIRPHICRLRQKIEPDSGHPHLIRTVPGKGYLFAS
jgi:two-component system KDP operon response regulator KdpE